MQPKLSVVIATCQRPAILRRCLEHLARQTFADSLEVIVVHDGKDDASTAALFLKPKTYNLKPITYFSIEKSQQGVARNRGTEKATAPLTLFINDDIFLAPDACERHLAAHIKLDTPCDSFDSSSCCADQEKAVLGFTTWDPEVGVTPVMRWLEKSGWQFGYPMIEQYTSAFIPKKMQERFTYTSNISLRTETAKKFPFREDVTLYGWEDIEWGMRLKKADVALFYEPAARALHHHRITIHQSLDRMETIGRSAGIMKKKLPDFDRVPRGVKMLAYRLRALFPTLRGRHCKAFLKGLKAAG